MALPLTPTPTKDRLLQAAMAEFAEHGFRDTTVAAISEAAGANIAAINYHFGSREGLLALVMVRYLGPIISDRLARLDELGRKEVPLEGLVDAFDGGKRARVSGR